MNNTEMIIKIPYTTGYIIHDDHIDEVHLSCIHLDTGDIVFEFEGICSEDDLPFSMDVPEKELINRVLTKQEALNELKNFDK